ncbi:hypothetical protein RB2150_10881 [Rhodobacteraceae bacterium HTCC2150]|nr:hypothetical protein RB2150_10881 [Rhodobacteraceae bacterium HTCC2150]
MCNVPKYHPKPAIEPKHLAILENKAKIDVRTLKNFEINWLPLSFLETSSILT